jgi:hypothetical protein
MTGAAAASCALGAVVAFPGLTGPPTPAPRAPAPPPPAPSPPVAVPPFIMVVRLSADFSPSTLRLAVGQRFELVVSNSVEATGPAIPAACSGSPPSGGPGALLSAQCVGNGSYLFTAEQPGSIVLSATVRPRCALGLMCPQWIAEPNLSITITPGPLPGPPTSPAPGPPPSPAPGPPPSPAPGPPPSAAPAS